MSFMSGETVSTGVSQGRQSRIQVGSISIAGLPDRPAAYEGVDVLVISDISPSAVNPRALKALSMWTASGGTLVLSTGPNYQNYLNPFYDELLPVRITGVANLARFDSLSRLGRCAFPTGSMAVARSTVKPTVCSVVISESGVPIYAERRYGAGKVVYLAFDHLSKPFRDWNGQTEFWKSIISAKTPGPLVEAQGSSDSRSSRYGPYYPGMQGQRQPDLAGVVEQNPSIKTPSFGAIAIFLFAYLIVLVPVNYFVLQRKQRRELAWVSTPIIVLLFAVGAYGIGYTMKGGRVHLDEATFVEGSTNSRYARAITEATLFSPASRSYQLAVSDPFSMGQVLPTGEDERLPRAYIGEQTTIENIRMAMWSAETFESVSGVDLGGRIESDLMLDGTRMWGEIRNNTGIDFADCVVIWGGSSISIGGLAKGASAAVNISHTPGRLAGLPHYPGYGGGVRDLSARLRDFAKETTSGAGSPMLLARAAREGGVFSLSGEQSATGSCTCYAFRLDYGVGGTFSLDPSSVSARIIESQGRPGPDYEEQDRNIRWLVVKLEPGGYIIASYHLPVPANCEVTGLKVHRRGPGANVLVVSLYNDVTGKWDEVAVNAPIARPSCYICPGSQVGVKIKAPRGCWDNSVIAISAEGRKR